MRGPNTEAFKQGFLKNMIWSLQACSARPVSLARAMNLQERKRAIKSWADVAMATARGGGARWPQALLASPPSRTPCKVQRCKKIVRRCHHHRRRRDGTGRSLATTASISSREIARRLVWKRTKVLRRMIPGGELLDEVSLLREAMDYVAHLRAQVDVLRHLSKLVK